MIVSPVAFVLSFVPTLLSASPIAVINVRMLDTRHNNNWRANDYARFTVIVLLCIGYTE